MWNKLKSQLKEWRGVLMIAPSVAALIVAGSAVGVFQLLEWATLDVFFHLRSEKESRIVVVTVGESDIEKLRQWPMSDRALANLIRNINAQNPTAIGIDIYRDLPVNPGHEELQAVFSSTPNLIGVEKVGGNAIAPPPILDKLGQVAASDLLLDSDGKIRRSLILIGNAEGEFREGLGAKLALMYLEEKGIELEVVNEEKTIYGLGEAVFVPITDKEGGYVRGDRGGYQILLHYTGEADSFPTISLTDVLKNNISADFLKDKIVLVGATAPSLNDLFQTPYYSTVLPNSQLMPGVFVHANIASQILRASLENRPLLRASTHVFNGTWIVIWSFASAIACWQLLENKYISRNLYFLSTISCILVGAGVLVAVSYIAFLEGVMIPIFTPSLAIVVSAILTTNYHNQRQLKQKNEQLEDYSATLEEKVRDRTSELAQANQEVRHVYAQLKEEHIRLQNTQSQLVQQEKMASLGQLVAGIAHEINNPVNFISGNITHARDYASDLMNLIDLYQEHYPEPHAEISEEIDIIELDFLKEDLTKLLTSMKVGSDRIREIVKGLRNFSRLDESELKKADINDGITSTLMILQHRIKEQFDRQAIEVIQDLGELPLVECYPGQLNQVFMNLLSNAVDVLEEKMQKDASFTPQIRISTSTQSNHIIIKIGDNGKGIPLEIQEQIFDPFFTTKEVGKGTGLGLSISYSIIVERHGGKIQVNSIVNEGTEFVIEIPIEAPSE